MTAVYWEMAVDKLKDLIKCLPETGHPMDALQASVAAMGMFYPARDVTNAANSSQTSARPA